MLTIYSPRHVLRDPRTELAGGELVAPLEAPVRATLIRDAIAAAGLGPIRPPDAFGADPVLRVHDPAFVAFLETAWARWRDAKMAGEAIPTALPARRMRQRPVRNIEGLLGYYALSTETSIDAGTWEAALVAKDVALTAAAAIASGAATAFALCRPPGHHAAIDLYGGYCFLNNAAIATQWLRDRGIGRVAILDVDFHHGNGTQDVFDARDDVLFVSLHGDPEDAFPHFSGFADEIGRGPGEGFTANYPLPPGTDWHSWSAALDDALARIRRFGPDVLVVSLGVDTFVGDPIGFFRFATDDFERLGERLSQLGYSTLYVLEGGYAVDAIGDNVVGVLRGDLQVRA